MAAHGKTVLTVLCAFALTLLFPAAKAATEAHFSCAQLPQTKIDAENGDANAQIILSKLHYSGRCGVPKSWDEAIRLAKLASQKGLPEAEGLLAFLFTYEPDAPKNDVEAVRLAKRAAEQNVAAAQVVLGTLYDEGRGGLARDPVEADKWYIIAETYTPRNNGLGGLRQKLEAHMPEGDISRARREAASWKPTVADESPEKK